MRYVVYLAAGKDGLKRKREFASLPSGKADPHRQALVPIVTPDPHPHSAKKQQLRASATVGYCGAAFGGPSQAEGAAPASNKPVRRLPSRLTVPTLVIAGRPVLTLTEVDSFHVASDLPGSSLCVVRISILCNWTHVTIIWCTSSSAAYAIGPPIAVPGDLCRNSSGGRLVGAAHSAGPMYRRNRSGH